jgi:hypothetical protein
MSFGPIYIGTTTIDALGELKVGSNNVSKVYVGDRQVFPSSANFSGSFVFAVNSGTPANISFRAQDGSTLTGHFPNVGYVTTGSTSGPLTLTGSINPQQIFRILINSQGGGVRPVIVTQITATSASITTENGSTSGTLYVNVVPDDYTSVVTLSGTLTVTSTPIPVTPYTITFRGKNSSQPTANDSASIQYSTSSATGPWTTISTKISTTACTTKGTATILGGSNLYVQLINNSSSSIYFGSSNNGTCPDPGYLSVTSYVVTASQYLSVTTANSTKTNNYYTVGINY